MSESLLQIKPISEMPLVRRDAPVPLGPEAPSAALISLGCAKNTVDSEIMLAALAGVGYRLVSEAEDAQVAIINTCGFIEDAKRESIDTILEVAQLKESGDLETLVVAGCLAERYRGELAQGLPEVDLFIGTREYDQLPALLSGERGGAREAFSDTLMDYGRRLPRHPRGTGAERGSRPRKWTARYSCMKLKASRVRSSRVRSSAQTAWTWWRGALSEARP